MRPMSRESDWHVFDKACDITAMAVRGTAGGGLPPSAVADLFREIYQALSQTADSIESAHQRAGF